jgi:hypothetical protein
MTTENGVQRLSEKIMLEQTWSAMTSHRAPGNPTFSRHGFSRLR